MVNIATKALVVVCTSDIPTSYKKHVLTCKYLYALHLPTINTLYILAQ